MPDSKQENRRFVGFVTVRQHAEHGYFGGYLIVNCHGRPLEFHCTLPVKPSRAQEILYGRTLDDFICGEQITRALTAKAKLETTLLFTDCIVALASRFVSSQPIALIRSDRSSVIGESPLRIPGSSTANLLDFRLADYQISIPSRFPEDQSTIQKCWDSMNLDIDLREPFERIGEALLEAHPSARAA